MDESKKLNPIKAESKLIILPFENIANPHRDEQGRTPLHDFALGKGVVGAMTLEYINAAEDMLKTFFANKAKFDIQDNDGKTPLDLALEGNSVLLKKLFITYSLLANPELAKPSSLAADLSAYWDECIRVQQLKTDSQQSTSSSSAAFFKAPASANAASYDAKEKDDAHKRPRLN